jgi:hypothetical protein
MSHRTLETVLAALESTLPAVKYLHEHEGAEETLKEIRAAIKLGRAEIENTINSTWMIEDVKSIRPRLSKAKCRAVLESAEDNHDAEIGINWDVLRCHADELYPERK